MIDKIIQYCEEYGTREGDNFNAKYHFRNGRSISFHRGALIGHLEDAITTIEDAIIKGK
jgi:hypothetical protein